MFAKLYGKTLFCPLAFALFSALLRPCVCARFAALRLHSFALICALLHPSASDCVKNEPHLGTSENSGEISRKVREHYSRITKS